jgi:hypothetical protein
MTIKTFWIITIKLIGLYLLLPVFIFFKLLFEVLESWYSGVSHEQFTFNTQPNLLIASLSIALLLIRLILGAWLIFRTQRVMEILRLNKSNPGS